MKVLALVETQDHVCCRYRVRAFGPALERCGGSLDVIPLRRGFLSRRLQLGSLPDHDAVILQRKLLPAWHFNALRRRAGRLVFDFDDAVLYRDSYDPRGPHCPRRARRFALTVRNVDAVVAGNDFLADCALRAGAKAERVRVIPTCVDTDKYRTRLDDDRPTGRLDLVWIGSSSTLEGLERRRPLWDRIAREVPGVRMRVVCDRVPDLGAMPVVPVPWSEANEAGDLATADVGVSWLPDDLWSRGKCGLKVLQYQAAGLPVLANPVGVHPEMIRPGATGALPDSDDAWVNAVRALADDPPGRRLMGLAARASVETHYSVRAWEGAFVATLAGAHAVAPPPSRRSNGPRAKALPGRPARDSDRTHG